MDTVETFNIQILNPKAKDILKNLVDLNLIKIKDQKNRTEFSELINNIRNNPNKEISLEEITKEVEDVRGNKKIV